MKGGTSLLWWVWIENMKSENAGEDEEGRQCEDESVKKKKKGEERKKEREREKDERER